VVSTLTRTCVVPARESRASLSRALVVILAVIACQGAASDDVVVIVNKANNQAIDQAFIVRAYTGALKGWPDGTPVIVFDQDEDSEIRAMFCTSILRRSLANLKAIRSQNIFTGKGLPPKIESPDTAMKQAVASNPNAIGYIRQSQIDSNVKVVPR
jgi:ABC-type phosphate transport system substrate-binding protein